METTPSLTSALASHLREIIETGNGWIGFGRFMEVALYTPGLGYYARGDAQFGRLPYSTRGAASDFVTAPEVSPYFGRALAVQVAQALQVTGTREVWEFGAGSGALATELLGVLGGAVDHYTIVDVSGALQQRQRATLAQYGDKVHWAMAVPTQLRAVVVGNEVLDAMPVQLLWRHGGVWHERGVGLQGEGACVWVDRPTDQRPPVEIPGDHDYLTEIHPQADGFIRMLAERLVQGAAFFIDYGFPEREYYHAQRQAGTVMCHRAHRMDTDPLVDVGAKDITAHVNFTGLALAAQEAGASDPTHAALNLLGYTTQARFLMNCGLLPMLAQASLQERAMGQKLLMEHEMGELFKVIGFCRGTPWDAIGFAQGDRTHTL